MDNKAKMTGTVVLKHFKLAERLGTGAFGEIYKARDISKPEEVYAAKIEELNAKHPQLYFEAKLYRLLNTIQPTKGEKVEKEDKDRGIPKIYAMSTEGPYNIMLMDLLGKSLEDLFVANNKRFSLKTVVLIADQLLERIEYIHSREFLHRDIKPDNFLIGEGKKADKIYMIDLGLAKKYVKDGKHIPYKEGKELTGTARYASINTHMGIQQSRRDDIESIGYVLIYFLKGILPWQNMKGKDTKTKYENIKDKKQSTPVDVLCSDCPPQFKAYLEYAKSLKFEDKPDYSRLRKLFLKVREDKNYTDEKFDWSVEKLIEQKPITYIPQNKLKDPINVEETNGKVEKLEVFEPLKPKKSQEAPFEKTNQSNKAMNFSKTQTKTGSEKPSLFQIPKVPAPKISMINR